jgi:3-deoxy-D-manno-octulosonate 8-phosphate phosphatase (KDO 8-P phosphatase)
MFENVKAVAMDVDGVLTDGTVWWGPGGEEFKRFCYADVTGIPRAQQSGIALALVSGESSPGSMEIVQRFADKLKIADVYKGCHDKAAAVRNFAEKHGFQLPEICFIGDDVQDIPAMIIVGVAAVPADAHPVAKANAHFTSSRKGGRGVVREILDSVMEEQGLLPKT